MVKREDRLRPLDHELRQVEGLKALEPNATPVKYAQLSDALVDVAIAALGLVRALEAGESKALDFGRLYDLVDSLEDTLPRRA